MKNSFKIFSIMIIFIYSVAIADANEFKFEAKQLNYLNNSKIIEGIGNIKIIDKNNTEIYADKFQYNEKTGILNLNGNIKFLDKINDLIINADEFEKLMIEDLEIREFGNSVLRNELMAKVQKEIALASLKGKERLVLLRKNYPNIENQISHTDIASYLGITTISLSRLRTKS